MSGGLILFLVLGLVSLVAGLAVMIAAIARQTRDRPAGVVMLMAGMMATAFGLLLAGFAIAYAMSAPAAPSSQGAK